jgi:hypothetical protein
MEPGRRRGAHGDRHEEQSAHQRSSRTPEANRTLLFTSRAGGSVDAPPGRLRPAVRAKAGIRFGLVTRTSGIEYGKSGSVSFDSTLDGGGPSIGASMHDGSATFEFKLPFEMDGGIALIGKRAEVEFDIKALLNRILRAADQQ